MADPALLVGPVGRSSAAARLARPAGMSCRLHRCVQPALALPPDLHKWALFWVFRVMFALVGWGLTVVLGTLRGVVL